MALDNQLIIGSLWQEVIEHSKVCSNICMESAVHDSNSSNTLPIETSISCLYVYLAFLAPTLPYMTQDY